MIAASAVTASAQTTKSTKEDREKKLGAFLTESRRVLGDAGNAIGDFFGFDDRIDNKDDLIKIKHVYYMPLYSVNLYKGTDTAGFREECTALFARRFPLAKVLSNALPQTQWVREDMVKNDMVVGYTETMYCYIIAKDGEDGYINARFSYKRIKQPGTDYSILADNWPKWERTDFLSVPVYAKLLTK